jgi:elongation factor Ts
VKALREKTGAGILDCRAALKESAWDFEKAVDALRKKGVQVAQKRGGRATNAGKVECYIHAGGKIGTMIEVNCETDFVARTEEFGRFARDLAMQVAATGAQYVERSEVPAAAVEREKAVLAEQVKGKPPAVAEKIIQGKLDKFYQEVCLLEQPFIRDDKTTIQQLLTELIAKTGENVRVRRFAKFVLGD